MSDKDETKSVNDDAKNDDAPKAEEVQKKAADGEALTLEELEAVNTPPARPDNDDADIGRRFEASNYAPDAQPDLNAPAYVLARQAAAAAKGEDDTRQGAVMGGIAVGPRDDDDSKVGGEDKRTEARKNQTDKAAEKTAENKENTRPGAKGASTGSNAK